jgi:hypothetical protein
MLTKGRVYGIFYGGGIAISQSPLRTGDLVEYKGKQYYCKLNGNAVYIYKDEEMTIKVGAPSKSSVKKISKRAEITDEGRERIKKELFPKKDDYNTYVEEMLSSELRVVDLDAKNPEGGYVYVGKDMGTKRNRYKIGVTKDLQKRLKNYRTHSPEFIFVIKAWVPNRKQVEKELHDFFAEYRVGSSDFFDVHLWRIEERMKKMGLELLY